jgi:hypothetical protein
MTLWERPLVACRLIALYYFDSPLLDNVAARAFKKVAMLIRLLAAGHASDAAVDGGLFVGGRGEAAIAGVDLIRDTWG